MIKWRLIGYASLLLFAVVFAGWNILIPLESAAIASGYVSLDSNEKQIQHLEGGIIKKILVREGQEVLKNQILIELDTTQLIETIEQLNSRIKSNYAQLELIKDELETVKKLFQQGQATKPRLLALQRRVVEIEGQIEEFKSQLKIAQSNIARSEIRAPIDGTIRDQKVFTIGGIIKAGETLMTIVPKNDSLTIEIKINPNDIDVVKVGLKTYVWLTPYNSRFSKPVLGRIQYISADRFIDAKTNTAYYQAKIVIEDKSKLYPGLPVEVIIITGQQTMINYLVSPIVKSFRRAFRED
jgi:RND family efflux transporter MFP subunit